jgi:hypothetical protein
VWILLPGDIREDGIRKLQISNATIGCDKQSILLAFCKAKTMGFSNPAILEPFRLLEAISEAN